MQRQQSWPACRMRPEWRNRPRLWRSRKHRARRHAVSENLSAVEALGNACRQLQFGEHFIFQKDRVVVRSSGQERFGAQFRGAKGVVETLSGNRVHQARTVADHGPTISADFERRESLGAKGGKNVRVKAGTVPMDDVPFEPLFFEPMLQ